MRNDEQSGAFDHVLRDEDEIAAERCERERAEARADQEEDERHLRVE